MTGREAPIVNSPRVLVLLSALTVVTTTIAVVPADAAPADHVVHLAADAAAARGLAVIDDYGAFVTASLGGADVARLRADGIGLEPIAFESGRGAFRLDIAAASDGAIPADLAAGATDRHIVQFRGPVKAEWADALATTAIRVYDYLPGNAFLARLPAGGADAAAALPGVRAVAPYHPAFKLAPELHDAGVARATVLAYPDEPLALVLAELAGAGAAPLAWATTPLEHVVDVDVDATALRAVARLERVMWIEPAYDDGSLDNAQASAITQGGATGSWPVHDEGVNGSSQIASVCDTGTNTQPIAAGPLSFVRMTHEMHDDVNGLGLIRYNAHLTPNPLPVPLDHRKIDLYYSPQEGGNRGDSDDSDGHGTHTSGTIAGDAPVYATRGGNDGVAFAAKLQICDITIGSSFQILNDYANYWNPAYDRGARVNSNSWGSTHTNAYTEKARQHDAYVWTHRDMNILRSMGNTGATGSIRPEAVAKSALGIGATQNGAGAGNIASFSTGGLTTDGRVKPNVVAPGDCLQSSTLPAANSYTCLSGTSMSTPTVAGAATLVRDYFEKGYYPSGAANGADSRNPSAALVRATLQISGREIAGDRGEANFPNKAQGWGRVTLEDVLHFTGDARETLVRDEGDNPSLATGGVATTLVTVAAGQPLRVMIAWADPAGAAGANPALVNDLDLVVVGPDGARVGNAFVAGQVPVGPAAADRRNVEEAVYVNAPVAGTYEVRVSGFNVPNGPQPYALVVTGDLA